MRFITLVVIAASAACYGVDAGPFCALEDVEAALARADPGDVVRLGACRIRGSLVVPPDVTLEGSGREETELWGPEEGVALTLQPGAEGTSVAALSVHAQGCAGVLASGGGVVSVRGVTVEAERGIGLALESAVTATIDDVLLAGPVTAENANDWAPDGRDLPTAGLVALEVASLDLSRVEARGFGAAGIALLDSETRWTSGLVADTLAAGLVVSGGTLVLDSVEVVHTLLGTRLAPPTGVLLRNGAAIDALALTVRDGDGPGILMRGATGRLEGITVEGNAGIGVLISSTTAMALEGGRLSDNVLAALLVQESSGVTLRDLVVERTGRASVITELGVTELADGIEVTDSTSAILLERLTLRGHPRVGAVVDLAGGDGAGIAFRDVSVDGEALGVVVQGGLPHAGWDDEIERTGRTRQNDADFLAEREELPLLHSGPTSPEDPPSPQPPLCVP